MHSEIDLLIFLCFLLLYSKITFENSFMKIILKCVKTPLYRNLQVVCYRYGFIN